MALADPKAAVREEAINTLSSMSDSGLIVIFRHAADDSSYAVVSAAMHALDNANHYLARQVADSLQLDGSKQINLLVASLYASQGATSRLNWIQKVMMKSPTDQRFNLLEPYISLVKKADTKTLGDQVPFIQTLANHLYENQYRKLMVFNLGELQSHIKDAMKKAAGNDQAMTSLKDISGKLQKISDGILSNMDKG